MNPTRSSHAWASIVSRLSDALDGCPPDVLDLFDLLFTAEPSIPTARVLAAHLEINEHTLTSRWQRAGLPSPKRVVLFARLVRAAYLLEARHVSAAAVSDALHFASPQSFGRTLALAGFGGAKAFRRAYSGDAMLARFVDEIITPHREAWRVELVLGPIRGRQAVAA
jgi:AraC-like DNA-binding protein